MRIVLVGYMGSGKSACGKQLAKNLKLNFIDLDVYITQKQTKSISEIFETEGEESFRKLEALYLKEVLSMYNVIISVGGGTPCFNNNMVLINESSTSFYIKVDAAVLSDRLLFSKTVRPLIAKKNKEELLEFIKSSMEVREPYYLQANHTIISGQKNIPQLINEIKNVMNNKGITL